MNEQKIRDLKAELEQVDYEEFEELRKKVELLTHRFNELLDWLSCEGKEEKLHTKWELLKVKKEVMGYVDRI